MSYTNGSPVDLLGPVQYLVTDLVEDRIAKIVGTLVASHGNKTITGQEAVSGVAEIAALRALLRDLVAKTKMTHHQ